MLINANKRIKREERPAAAGEHQAADLRGVRHHEAEQAVQDPPEPGRGAGELQPVGRAQVPAEHRGRPAHSVCHGWRQRESRRANSAGAAGRRPPGRRRRAGTPAGSGRRGANGRPCTPASSVTIPSDFAAGRDVQQRILETSQRHGFGTDTAFAIRIALEEALVNAIKHGNRLDPARRSTSRPESPPSAPRSPSKTRAPASTARHPRPHRRRKPLQVQRPRHPADRGLHGQRPVDPRRAAAYGWSRRQRVTGSGFGVQGSGRRRTPRRLSFLNSEL